MAMKINKNLFFNNLKTLLFSSRPVSWINTAFPFIATYLFINGIKLDLIFWIALLFFLIPYNMLIYVINDIYDYESDMQNPRKGGIEGAILAKNLHPLMYKSTILASLPFITYLLTTGTISSKFMLIFALINAVAYSMPPLRLKERPLLDSVSSSLHFVSPMLYASALLGWPAVIWPYAVSFFAWGMASHAFGAVQDIIPDQKAGLSSIATYFGAKKTVRISLLLYATAIILLILKGMPSAVVAIAGIAYPVIIAPYIGISDNNSDKSNVGWKKFMKINQLIGFIITLILILHLR